MRDAFPGENGPVMVLADSKIDFVHDIKDALSRLRGMVRGLEMKPQHRDSYADFYQKVQSLN